MYKYFVYLIISENRLIIVDGQIKNSDYCQLMDTCGGNLELAINSCKMFCLGYIYGGQYGKQVKNSPYEFQ